MGAAAPAGSPEGFQTGQNSREFRLKSPEGFQTGHGSLATGVQTVTQGVRPVTRPRTVTHGSQPNGLYERPDA